MFIKNNAKSFICTLLLLFTSWATFVECFVPIFNIELGANLFAAPKPIYPENDFRYIVRSFAIINKTVHIFFKTAYGLYELSDDRMGSTTTFQVQFQNYLTEYSHQAPWHLSRASALCFTFTNVAFQHDGQVVLLGGHRFSVDAENVDTVRLLGRYTMQTTTTIDKIGAHSFDLESGDENIYHMYLTEEEEPTNKHRFISGDGFFFHLHLGEDHSKVHYYEMSANSDVVLHHACNFGYINDSTIYIDIQPGDLKKNTVLNNVNVSLTSSYYLNRIFDKNGFIQWENLFMANEHFVEVWKYNKNESVHYFTFSENVLTKDMIVTVPNENHIKHILPFLFLIPTLLIGFYLFNRSLLLHGNGYTYSFCVIDNVVYLRDENGLLE